MPVYRDAMKTMTTRKICQLTPIAAFASKPTKWPTSAWSMIPWMPPIVFWRTLGQAIFQTAVEIGPSTIARS